MGRIELPNEANWQPLRLIITDEKLRREFMFMGTFVASNGAARIELYKTRSEPPLFERGRWRRLLFFDGAAQGENPYQKISRREALERLGAKSEK